MTILLPVSYSNMNTFHRKDLVPTMFHGYILSIKDNQWFWISSIQSTSCMLWIKINRINLFENIIFQLITDIFGFLSYLISILKFLVSTTKSLKSIFQDQWTNEIFHFLWTLQTCFDLLFILKIWLERHKTNKVIFFG